MNRYFEKVPSRKWNSYKWHLNNLINSSSLLEKYISLDIETRQVVDNTKFSITPHLLSLINCSDYQNDPIAKQIVPNKSELVCNNFLKNDPFNEKNRTPAKNIIKRYPDRVLLVTSNICPSYCRFCTRKWNWQENWAINKNDIREIVGYLENNMDIREVIISGGEPFLLNTDFLEEIIRNIRNVKHIEVIRIATRILTFLPQRVDRRLINMLKKYGPIWIVTHFNHPFEITSLAKEAVDKLLDSKVAIVNQSVLLKDINDNYETLSTLMKKLESMLIKPYYLFQCDLIEGTAHFRVSIDKGMELIGKMRGNIGGICQPTYIIDLPEGAKVPILPDYILKRGDDKLVIRNYEGKNFDYPLF